MRFGTDPQGTRCPYCRRTSYHPTDKATGWCAACARFYPTGEGPATAAQFRRFNERRIALIQKETRLAPDGSRGDGLTPDEQVELDRLNQQIEASGEAKFPLPAAPSVEELIRQAHAFVEEHLKEE